MSSISKINFSDTDYTLNASSISDYNYSDRKIQVGFAGAGLTASNLGYVAGYTTDGAKIKDVNKAQMQSWLGLGTAAYANINRHLCPYLGSTETGNTPVWLLGLKSAGRPVYSDPEFANSYNGVEKYANSGGDNLAVTRGLATDFGITDPGNSSGYVIQIKNTGTVAPGLGGFYLNPFSRANAIFIQVFRAMIPSGYSVNIASNPMGTSYQDQWLTSNAGTGKWEWYFRAIHCGSTGSFSSGGHVYLTGTAGTTDSPVIWYLSYANVIDITKGNYDGLRTRYSDALSTARNLKIGNTSKSFNGSGDVSWSLSEIGCLPLSGGTMSGDITFPYGTGIKIATGTSWDDGFRSIPFSNASDPSKIQWYSNNATTGLTFNANSGTLRTGKFQSESGGFIAPAKGSNPRTNYSASMCFYNCNPDTTSSYNFGVYQWNDEFQFNYRTSATNTFKGNSFTIRGSDGLFCIVNRPVIGNYASGKYVLHSGDVTGGGSTGGSSLTVYDKTLTIPTSLPASDVYSWAKASTKPSYSWSEITSKPSTFTPSSHTHSYLPLSGGTMTGGQIARTGSGGMWYRGRTTALLKTTDVASAGWNVITSLKTKDGDWSMGVLGTENMLRFCYTTDTNFTAGNNDTTHALRLDETGNLITSGSTTSSKFIKSGGTSSQFLKADGSVDSNSYSTTSHTHTKSQITDFPASLKNPNSLILKLNSGTTEGTNMFTYDGSAAKTVNITPSGIGAATSGHTHSTYFPYSGGTFTGPISFNSTSLLNFSGSPSFLVGIEAFSDGGTLKWADASKVSVGSATKATNATYSSYLGTSSANYSYSTLNSALAGKSSTSHTHNYASTVKIGDTSYSVSSNTITLPAYPTAASLGLSSAMKFIGTTTTALTDGATTNPITISSTSVTATSGNVVLYGNKEFLWNGSTSKWEELGDESSHALKTISIKAGTGLSGGGTLEADRTLSLSTATSSTLGGVKSATTGTTANRDYNVQVNSDGTMKVNVPWTDTYTQYPYGFSSRLISSWGNQIGTIITDWHTASGGDVQWMNNNPISGQVSLKVDGTVYINEGNEAVASQTWVNNKGYTTNTGTVTSVAVKMNGTTKGTVTTSGTIDLGTVLTDDSTYFKQQRTSTKSIYDYVNDGTGDTFIASLPNGTYSIPYTFYDSSGTLQSSHSELLVRLALNAGSASALEFWTNYGNDSALKYRKTIDNNRISGAWKTIANTDYVDSSISSHTHDDRYYTESEMDTKLSAKQDKSTAVTHTASTAVGSSTQPVYIASDGTATAIGYTIAKSVPANAVFTDTNTNQTVKGNGTVFGSTAAINIVGSGATTVTADTTNNKITISSTDNNTTYTAGTGLTLSSGSFSLNTAGSALGGVKTTSTVTSNSGYTACPIIGGIPYYKDTNTTYDLSGYATQTWVNNKGYLTAHQDISGKSSTSHTHSVKINGTTKTIAASGGTAVDLGTYLTSHQDISGKADKASITAGTAGTSSATSGSSLDVPYVTVNTQGIVTGYGTHKHTVSGFAASSHTHSQYLTSIPTASSSTLGGIKVGSNLSIDSNGVLSGTANTTYSAGAKLSLSGTQFSHATASVTNNTDTHTANFGDTITYINSLIFDDYGHPTEMKFIKTILPSTLATTTPGLVKTSSTVTSNSGYTACPIIGGIPYYKDTNTDTHYASSTIVAKTATATANASASITNGNVYLNHIENGAVKSSHLIKGSGATTVTANSSNQIIISSTNTNTTYSANGLNKLSGTTMYGNGVVPAIFMSPIQATNICLTEHLLSMINYGVIEATYGDALCTDLYLYMTPISTSGGNGGTCAITSVSASSSSALASQLYAITNRLNSLYGDGAMRPRTFTIHFYLYSASSNTQRIPVLIGCNNESDSITASNMLIFTGITEWLPGYYQIKFMYSDSRTAFFVNSKGSLDSGSVLGAEAPTRLWQIHISRFM